MSSYSVKSSLDKATQVRSSCQVWVENLLGDVDTDEKTIPPFYGDIETQRNEPKNFQISTLTEKNIP